MAQFNFPKNTQKNPMAAKPETILKDVNILGSLNDETKQVLSQDAAVFLALLHRTFNQTRKSLVERRQIRQAELDKGNLLDFLPGTKYTTIQSSVNTADILRRDKAYS